MFSLGKATLWWSKSFSEGLETLAHAMASLLLISSGANHLWGNKLHSSPPDLPTTLAPSLLATCPSSRVPKPAGVTQHLVRRTGSTKNQLIERCTLTKFGPSFFHLPLVSNNSVINLSLVWTILFPYCLIKRHYPICYCLVKHYYYKL